MNEKIYNIIMSIFLTGIIIEFGIILGLLIIGSIIWVIKRLFIII